jgi:hypothetical protein
MVPTTIAVACDVPSTRGRSGDWVCRDASADVLNAEKLRRL